MAVILSLSCKSFCHVNTTKSHLFGILGDDNENWRLKNQLLLSAKRFIFIGKCRGSPLSIDAFNTLLKSTGGDDCYKDKLDLHIAK